MGENKLKTVYLLKRTDKPDDGTDIYVGSTSGTLRRRLREHKSLSKIKRGCNIKLYRKMCEVGLGSWEIVPLLSFMCDKKTICEFEKEWCNALNADLNMRFPFSGFDNKKEYLANYRESNKETIKQQITEYYKVNKETIKQQRGNYRGLNKQNKVYHCDVCDKSIESNKDLKRHFDSLRHQYAYLNSVD